MEKKDRAFETIVTTLPVSLVTRVREKATKMEATVFPQATGMDVFIETALEYYLDFLEQGGESI